MIVEDFELDIGAAYIKPISGNKVTVKMNQFRGQVYVHIREYGMDGDTGKFFPTKNGYAILGEEVDSVIEKLEIASNLLAEFYRRNTNQYEFDFMKENE